MGSIWPTPKTFRRIVEYLKVDLALFLTRMVPPLPQLKIHFYYIVNRSGWIALGVSIAAMIGSGMIVRSMPYQEGFGAKQLAW
jgi:hypothetical protein